MLNAKKERELVYLVTIDEIIPIEGAANVETARVGGWRIMVKKGQFKVGDPAIYFEIDSKVPEEEPFMFLAKKHFKVKTQKYFKGSVISQGLLMAAEDFGWTSHVPESDCATIVTEKNEIFKVSDESRFLTKRLGITYASDEDNKRKTNSEDKYKRMAQRRPHIFKQPWAKWFMRRAWGRKLMFAIFGKKKDKKSGWPSWVSKTDEERVQNMPWILENKDPWIATEKIDGTSTTFTYKKGKFGKHEFYICSRNVVFDKPDKKCYYDTNVYTEMAEKYDVENVLADIVEEYNLEWATIQGETFGAGIQKRDYGMKDHDFRAFNLIFSTTGRLNSIAGKIILETRGIPWVPIVDKKFILPDTIDELLAICGGKSEIDGKMREGLVFRADDGIQSFKAVDNNFLIKYH